MPLYFLCVLCLFLEQCRGRHHTFQKRAKNTYYGKRHADKPDTSTNTQYGERVKERVQ